MTLALATRPSKKSRPVLTNRRSYARLVTWEESPIYALFGLSVPVTPAPPPAPWSFRHGPAAPNLLTVTMPPTPTATPVNLPPRAPMAPMAPMALVGIDLQNRSKEVAKLLFAGFGRRIYQMGYDPDDVLQEVYKGLLIRNRGKCPWTAAKSSFGHYVHMVCGCLLSNYHRRQSRIRAMEQVGMLAFDADGDGMVSVDAATACDTRTECASYQDLGHLVDKDFVAYLCTKVPPGATRQMTLSVLPLAIDGNGRYEIASILDLPILTVAKVLKSIRAITADWAMDGFIH